MQGAQEVINPKPPALGKMRPKEEPKPMGHRFGILWKPQAPLGGRVIDWTVN